MLQLEPRHAARSRTGVSASLKDSLMYPILTTSRYSIRVGRSQSPRGPFLDKTGKDLTDGGGTLIYGSNGDTYAPGGQAVIRVGDTDVLYYHYCKTTFAHARSSNTY